MYYINIENGNLNGGSELNNSKYYTEDYSQIEVSQALYEDYLANQNKYIYDAETNSIISNPNYEAEQAQRERQRLDMLNLTAADVERAIYKAKGMDFEDVIKKVEELNGLMAEGLDENSPSTSQPITPSTRIDIKALKIELKANNFYRGNPYINAVGTLLGFTSEQLDEFFETNDYTKLIAE